MIPYTNYSIFVDKVINRIWIRKNLIWRHIAPVKFAKMLLGKNKIPTQHFLHLLSVTLGDINNQEFKQCISSEDASQIMLWADNAMLHKFNYLGSGWTQLSPMVWNRDFKSDYEWPNGQFYRTYKYGSGERNNDIKVVWELSRCHHLLWLAEAYVLTGKKEYANEVVCQIEHWIDNNPLMYSVNWTCAMDVAFRAINWLYALNLIKRSGVLTDRLCGKIYTSLFEHGFFIINNLEKTIPYSGNHYLSDLVGLLFISSFLRENRAARKWFKFAIKEFCNEVDNEININGVHYENSTSYHRLVSELFLSAYTLLVRQNNITADKIKDKISSLLNFVSAYTKPNRLSPIIGDNDDGRLLPFTPRDFRDHSYLLDFGAILFGKTYPNGYGWSAESYIITSQLPRKSSKLQDHKETFLCPEAGYAIIQNSNTYLIVGNTPFSLKRSMGSCSFVGTHTHSDLLSFELSVFGSDIIVDPGSYVYTSDKISRNKYRSTRMHNTVVIDGQDQHRMPTNNMFGMTADTKNHLLDIENKNSTVIGSYDKICSNGELHHKRQFSLTKNELFITDNLSYAGEHSVELYFHFAPNINITVQNNICIISNNNGLELKMIFDNMFEHEVVASTISPSYGTEKQNLSLRLFSTMNNVKQIITHLIWQK